MSLKEIRDRYKVPARRGQLVSVAGEPGTIRGSHCGRLRVDLNSGAKITCHPVKGVLYLKGGLTSE